MDLYIDVFAVTVSNQVNVFDVLYSSIKNARFLPNSNMRHVARAFRNCKYGSNCKKRILISLPFIRKKLRKNHVYRKFCDSVLARRLKM